jgi:tripartite ATP-independent transporter DctP family solute receptor
MKGPSAQKILKNMEPIGVKGLTWAGIGFRCVSNNKHSIEKLEDISGLKLRVMTNPIALETWKTLGANAVPMAFAEVFTALETKTIDGQENPLQHMYANKMHEVQKFISLTNHVYTAVGMIASKKWWDGLSPALQAAVQKAAVEAAEVENKLIVDGDKDVIKKFEAAGVKVNALKAEELGRIRDKVKPVAEKFREIVGADFYKAFTSELEAIRAKKK